MPLSRAQKSEANPLARLEEVKAKHLQLATPDFLERHRAFCAAEIDDDRIRCLDCEKWEFKPYYKKWECIDNAGCVPDILRRCLRSIKKKEG